MPIYTYRCEADHTWEEVRSIQGSEVSEHSCTTCSQNPMLRDRADRESLHGKKVPSSSIGKPILHGAGVTPTHFPNRKENK